MQRLKSFDSALDIICDTVLSARGGIDKNWQFTNHSIKLKLILGQDDTFLQQLSNYTADKNFHLPWDNTKPVSAMDKRCVNLRLCDYYNSDLQNLLLQEYYQWSANELFCKYIQTTTSTNNIFPYDISHKFGCNRNLSVDLINTPIKLWCAILHQDNMDKIRRYWISKNETWISLPIGYRIMKMRVKRKFG